MVIDAEEGVSLPPEWSPFNMRQYNLSILKPPISKTAGSSSSKASMSYTTAAKSLDLLRQNIQRSLNNEIKTVISKYFDLFFKPGIENIRNNLGPESVTDDHIQNMCRQILEEAKRMYPVYTSSPSPSSCNTGSAIDTNDTDYQSGQQTQTNINETIKLPLTSPSFGIKRESDTDSEASSMSNASKKIKKSANKNNAGNSGTSNNNTSTSSTSSPQKPKKPSGPSRKHVAQWDSNKLTSNTLFIMGAKANKALGFAQTRGRLYVKHPGLFKYASDSDDKEWLSKNKLMPATGGRAYIMLLDDIEKLARDNKLNVTINYDDIKGFRVPDFILDKMKSYITTWKKQYAEEAQRSANAANKNRNQNNSVSTNQVNSTLTASTSTNSSNSNSSTMTSLNPPPPPPLPIHSQQLQQQHPNPPNQQSLNSYHLSGNSPANVLYEPNIIPLSTSSQPHDIPEMREYIHMEKPPPMYPGHSNQQPPQQQQQQHTLSTMTNPSSSVYVHPTHLDPIEQALARDWSGVSDRSLLQYALQSTRSMGSWDPQDSFDLIESVTNGCLSGGGSMEENSPLLQLPSDGGSHLTGGSVGPVSPDCGLSAVLDQAFHYADT